MNADQLKACAMRPMFCAFLSLPSTELVGFFSIFLITNLLWTTIPCYCTLSSTGMTWCLCVCLMSCAHAVKQLAKMLISLELNERLNDSIDAYETHFDT